MITRNFDRQYLIIFFIRKELIAIDTGKKNGAHDGYRYRFSGST